MTEDSKLRLPLTTGDVRDAVVTFYYYSNEYGHQFDYDDIQIGFEAWLEDVKTLSNQDTLVLWAEAEQEILYWKKQFELARDKLDEKHQAYEFKGGREPSPREKRHSLEAAAKRRGQNGAE